VARLIDRVQPDIFHCPDFHAAMAVMYVERPLPVVLVLHNAEYQGAISTQHMGSREAKWFAEIFDLPEARIAQETIAEGKFSMLKPVVDYVRRYQSGHGVCAVSCNYALEAVQKHAVFWGLPQVTGIENCMPESERMAVAKKGESSYMERRELAKLAVQERFLLRQDKDARIFVFVGRWVKQKGVDYIADITEWMLTTYKDAQMIMVGPVSDAYGSYARKKMEKLSADDRFKGSLFVHAGFLEVPQDLKLACDFCLMPSRDEPFGYVDIEFAWFGAAIVGSLRGGLGKLPGFYFQVLNSDSATHMQRALRKAITEAMTASPEVLAAMSEIARSSTFPVEDWQHDLRQVYALVLQSFDWDSRPQEVAAATDDQDKWSNSDEQTTHSTWSGSTTISSVGRGPPSGPSSTSEEKDSREETLPSGEELLRQEASESEMQALVEAKLATKDASSAAAIIEVVEWERELSRESGPFSGVSRFLGRRVCGAPLLDWIICLSYVSGPLLSALTITHTTNKSSIAFFVVTPLTQASALVVWTLAACYTPPNLLMAVALLARLTYLPLMSYHVRPLCVAVVQGLVSPSDYVFLYYSFMGSSVGDVAKLAIRTGIIMGVRELWQPFFAALAESPYVLSGSVTYAAVVVSVLVPTLALLMAPTLYKAFPVPTLDCTWALQLRFLLLLGVATVLEAFSHTPSSALLVLRQAQFSLPGHTTYCLGLALATSLPMIFLAAILRRFPSYSVVIVKAFACCSLPAVLLQCWAQVEVDEAERLSVGLDALLFLSSAMGALAVFAVAVAVLATVGSRWRFVSYTCVIGVFCNLARAASFGIARAATGHEDPLSATMLPGVLAWQLFLVALPSCFCAVLIRIIAFFFFEQEATGMLQTRGHRRLVRYARSNSRFPLQGGEQATSARAAALCVVIPGCASGTPAVAKPKQ